MGDLGGKSLTFSVYCDSYWLLGAVIGFVLAPILWLLGLFSKILPGKKEFPTRTILHKYVSDYCQKDFFELMERDPFRRSSGALKPGEMCLVLGCPGAGCSTFLKTIANQRDGYAKISGNVLYAGIDAEEMAKYYKGEVVYNQEGQYRQSLPST
jgi:ATP-binding cassette subfamily G (WHITE) protein 2 (SNQ2)